MAEAPTNAIIAPSPKAQTMDDSTMTSFSLQLEELIAATDERRACPRTVHRRDARSAISATFSPRAADTLRRADRILAEDTRVTAKLLAHIGAKAPMSRYDDHSERSRPRARSSRGSASEAIALVSDAGTPLISDPGYKLVRAARAAGHAVHTMPGPCAAIAALTLAGLPTDRFLFLGFLPAKAKARADAIAEVADVRATLVLYESGPRLGDTLARACRRARRRARPRSPARSPSSRGMRDGHAGRACRRATPTRRPRARS